MNLTAAVTRAFAPATGQRHPQLGVEIELIPHRGGQPIDPAVLAGGFDPAFTAAARPSFEPGGQLELSPPPHASVRDVASAAGRLLARAEEIGRCRGIRFDLIGVDRRHDCTQVPLRSTTPRYLAMQREFDRTGQDGRRMMRLTASLQVCVDLLPGRPGVEQWLVSNLVGPALAVEFANSPGVARSRLAIWRGVDHRRTGYDGRHLDPADPVGAYAAFAAAADRFDLPDANRPDYHLSTLFPPVRPRGGYLEIRYLDAQPVGRIAEAVAVVAALTLEPRARRDALDLLLPRVGDIDGAWGRAEIGECPDRGAVLAIARAGMRRLPRDFLPIEVAEGRWAA